MNRCITEVSVVVQLNCRTGYNTIKIIPRLASIEI